MQTSYWTTGDGRKIRICDMDDDHLFNALKFVQKYTNEKRRGKPFAEVVRSSFWLLLEEAEDRDLIEKMSYEDLGTTVVKRKRGR